jgi:hypothetical protein
MTRDEIIDMAREAQLSCGSDEFLLSSVAHFVALVTAAEREACAQLCDEVRWSGYVPPEDGAAATYYDEAATECAEAIRARGKA